MIEVEIGDTGEIVEFDDDIDPSVILSTLNKQYRPMQQRIEDMMYKKGTVKPVESTLFDDTKAKIGQLLFDNNIISDKNKAFEIGGTLATGLGFLPPVAAAFAGDEVGRDLRNERYASAASKTALEAAGPLGDGVAAAIPVMAGKIGDTAKNLYKVQNTTEGGLQTADELGGLPSPSIAVADNQKGFENYGDISLVGQKDSFSNDPTFAADIYSARFPRPTNKINYKALLKEQDRVQDGLPQEFNTVSSDFYQDRIAEDPDRLAQSLPNKVAFLKTQGIDVDPTTFMSQKEAKKPNETFFNIFSDYYGEAGNRKIINLKTKQNPEFIDKSTRLISELGLSDSDLVTDGVANEKGVMFAMRALRQDRDASLPQEATFDRFAARDFIDGKVDERSEAFNQYINDQKNRLVSGKAFSVWNPDTATSKEIAFNLGNAVKLMVKGNPRNKEGFNYGVGNIRANVAPQLKSIKQITDRRGQIVADEEMIGVKQSFDDAFEYLEPELRKAWKYDSEPSMSDLADGLADYATGKGDDFNMSPELKSEVQDFFKQLADAPTNYFEIKPQRAVDVGEFFGAAVPEGTSPKVIKMLESKGLKIEKYKPSERKGAIDRLNERSGGKILFSGAGAMVLFGAANSEGERNESS